MVGAAMKWCNNYFEYGYIDGSVSIDADGEIDADGIANGQWVAITGSTFHNGVWKVVNGRLESDDEMPSETFVGRVWLLAPPSHFLRVCKMIDAFQAANDKAIGPYTSESFGAYSYTKATGSGGGLLTWNEAFAGQLKPYRHMFTEVDFGGVGG